MPHSIAIPLAASAVLVAAMTFAFLVRLATGRSGWIDTIWSAAVGLAGLVAVALAGGGDPLRRATVGAIVLLWSLRLAGHILARTRGAGDDPRYAALVEGWGESWRRSLFGFLMAQAVAGAVLAVAIGSAADNRAPFASPLDFAGITLALAGLALEATADRQLRLWRRRRDAHTPAICDTGLWAWSRHPNYLGEILFWWALPLVAFDPSRPLWSLPALAAPVLMTHLLVNVSGIPPLEAHMARTRGKDWEGHRRRVPELLPKLPRRDPPRRPRA